MKKDIYDWVKIENELPESDSAIRVRTIDGTEYSPCSFWEREHYFAVTKKMLGLTPPDGVIEEIIKSKGKYSISHWKDNNCSDIDFKSVTEWQYIHREKFEKGHSHSVTKINTMNPYKKYLSLDYEKLSEAEMMKTLDEVFGIDPTTKNGLFNEKSHYTIVDYITQASLKLKYKTVCDRLRKIFPLSFPEIEYHYPNPVPEPDMSITTMPMPIYPITAKGKKSVDDLNKLTRSFKKKNKHGK